MKKLIKKILDKLFSNKAILQNIIGLFLNIFNLKGNIRYYNNFKAFKKAGGKISNKYKIINEFKSNAGKLGHYFIQDLCVAQKIYENKPESHYDIGSRIDGFVAHVASFMPITLLDIRPMGNIAKNINFIQADLMAADFSLNEKISSISCLHVIEHFGLGRYGDKVDINGHIKGFENIIKLVEKKGIIYISFPIAEIDRVEFNAHRVFNQKSIFDWSNLVKELLLLQFDYIDDKGSLYVNHDIDEMIKDIKYGVGIYTFQKR